MIQGLLGGFRVLLNVWFGPDLATVHGCFAHVVVCTYAAAIILAGPVPGFALDPAVRSKIRTWAVAGVLLVFTQLIWGALTRHWGTALAQRLHLLTAFAATAVVVTIAVQLRTNADVKPRFGGYAFHLLGIVFLQVALGVEAYVGKFAAVGPFANLPPGQRPISDGQALTRTGHVLVGLALLASLVALAVRVSRVRTAVESVKQSDPEAA
jgi:heme A synthase